MKRRHFLGLLAGAPVFGVLGYDPTSNVVAQESGDQATVAALQTKVAVLATKAALQTKVAALQTQVARGNTTSAATTPTGERVLYQADWSKGVNGWSTPSGWKQADGFLFSGGSNSWSGPPFQPTSADYAIEAQIQLTDPECGMTYKQFGILARGAQVSAGMPGIIGGYSCSMGAAIEARRVIGLGFLSPIATQAFSPGLEWHTYRLELKVNRIRLLIDGSPAVEGLDNTFLDPGLIGVFTDGAQITVRSFKVINF